MTYPFYEVEVIKIIDETAMVKRFYFKVSPDEKFEFKAGQFVMLDLPLDSRVITRSYSIASAPTDDTLFEICAALKADGQGTPWLWKNLKVGTKLRCSEAVGKFILPESINHDLCFIATGTGIAPLRSMIMDIYAKKMLHKNIYLIFGNRWAKDILYRTEFEELQVLHPEFKFIPVLSRETSIVGEGRLGYVHQVYQELFANQRKAHFYLCGWSAMVREAQANLKGMGYTKSEIKLELYD